MWKIWNASRICVSSLRRGHANLLCIVPILVYVLPKRVHYLSIHCSFIIPIKNNGNYPEVQYATFVQRICQLAPQEGATIARSSGSICEWKKCTWRLGIVKVWCFCAYQSLVCDCSNAHRQVDKTNGTSIQNIDFNWAAANRIETHVHSILTEQPEQRTEGTH